MRGHLSGAMSQIYADDGGEELGSQTNCKGQGEEEGVYDGTGQIDVYGKNCHNQNHGHLQEQIAEVFDSSFKLSLRFSDLQPLRYAAKLGISSCVDDCGS